MLCLGFKLRMISTEGSTVLWRLPFILLVELTGLKLTTSKYVISVSNLNVKMSVAFGNDISFVWPNVTVVTFPWTLWKTLMILIQVFLTTSGGLRRREEVSEVGSERPQDEGPKAGAIAGVRWDDSVENCRCSQLAHGEANHWRLATYLKHFA